ncbi:flagellar motor switch protein FliN [Nostoc sp. HG1]|nr:flagellar motor switch protein FliN [Nostoc sp. HG1]
MSDMTEAPNFGGAASSSSVMNEGNFDLLAGVSLRISVEVGSASLTLAELLRLAEGSVVELDRQATDLLDIFANGTLIARGEVVAVEGKYGIRIVDVVAADKRLAGLERRS